MIFDDRTSVTRQSQAAFTAANLSEIDLEKLHGVRPRLTLAGAGRCWRGANTQWRGVAIPAGPTLPWKRTFANA